MMQQIRIGDILAPFEELLGSRPEPELLTLTEKNGFIAQRVRYNKRVARDDTSDYKVVRRFDIAFNPYLLWAGAIAQNVGWDLGLISPAYPTFRIREGYDERFVDYLLRDESMRMRYDKIAFGSVPRKRRTSVQDFLDLTIASPPSLPEQRRIAEVLDRVEGLRNYRRATHAQLSELTQSVFLDLFVDPATKGWPMTTIAGVAGRDRGSIRTGPFGSQLLHSEFTEAGISVLGIDNAVANEFRWAERRFISEAKYRQLRRYTVHPGDVLITIMGTCGRCAVVPTDIPTAINTKHLCCITLDQQKCLPAFLHAYFLYHPIAQRYLAEQAKGAIMSGLNMGIIREMPIPLAPIELQRQFSGRIEALKKISETQIASLAELDALRASLQHRAFRGEL